MKAIRKMSKGMCIIVFSAFILLGCTTKTTKGNNSDVTLPDTLVDTILAMNLEEKSDTVQTSLKEGVQKMSDKSLQNELIRNESKQVEIDTNRIYDQSEVQDAIPTLSDSQIPDFYSKHFKYPDMEPINGRGLADLVIEKDGTVSDVIIVKSIHPELDKEFIRVFKLLPKFIPGKIGKTPVRSKLRLPMTATVI